MQRKENWDLSRALGLFMFEGDEAEIMKITSVF